MKKIKRIVRSKGKPRGKRVPKSERRKLPLQVLVKFRLIVNSTKRHFKWVEQQCGINGAQLWALWELHRAPGLRVTELAAAMAMHQSTVSILLNRLVKAKLIERKRTGDDQRVVKLSITEAGKKLLKRAPKPARGVLPEALHRLSERALVSLDDLLGCVLKEMRLKDTQSMNIPLADILNGPRASRLTRRRSVHMLSYETIGQTHGNG